MDDSPIVFIDADEDDQQVFKRAVTELSLAHPVVVFAGAQAALDYLNRTAQRPFLIISEITMPGMTGLELRRQIEQDDLLRKKSIPFIFMTAPVDEYLVEKAYELTIQGLFEKKQSYLDWKTQLHSIIAYWTDCLHPKRFNS